MVTILICIVSLLVSILVYLILIFYELKYKRLTSDSTSLKVKQRGYSKTLMKPFVVREKHKPIVNDDQKAWQIENDLK